MKFIRWDSYTYKTYFKDSDWVAIDITWYTIYLTIRKQNSLKNTWDTTDEWVVLQKINAIHSDPVNWETIFVLSITDTNIPAWDYAFDIQITFAWWTKSSTWVGVCTVLLDATKS